MLEHSANILGAFLLCCIWISCYKNYNLCMYFGHLGSTHIAALLFVATRSGNFSWYEEVPRWQPCGVTCSLGKNFIIFSHPYFGSCWLLMSLFWSCLIFKLTVRVWIDDGAIAHLAEQVAHVLKARVHAARVCVWPRQFAVCHSSSLFPCPPIQWRGKP